MECGRACYRDGLIGLKDVRVDSINRDGVYIRLVRAALADGMAGSDAEFWTMPGRFWKPGGIRFR